MERERWKTRSEPEFSTARDVSVSNLAARQHGVINAEELDACDLDDDAISVRRDNGHLHRLHKGVYAVGHAKVTLEGCYLAAVKACASGAVLCRWSAAIHLKLIDWEDRFLKLTTIPSLLAVLNGPGPQRGRKKLARIIATGAAPTQSELEDAVLDLLLRGGFVHPSVNEPLFMEGRRIVPDFCWPEGRLIIEADGPHHDAPLERAADRERQRILEAHGYRVIRVTWKQVVAHPAATLRRIAGAGAPRAVANSG